MNRTAVFLAFVAIAIAGFAGVVVIVVVRPDATATIINTLITLLTIVSGFAITAYSLTKVDGKVEVVKKQTNGTLTALIESNRVKDEYIKALLAAAPAHIMEKVEK